MPDKRPARKYSELDSSRPARRRGGEQLQMSMSEKRTAAGMWNIGLGTMEIAKRFGIEEHTVYNNLKKWRRFLK